MTPPSTARSESPIPQRRRRPLTRTAMALVALLAIGVAVWALWGPRGGDGLARRGYFFNDTPLPIGTFFDRIDGGLYRIDDVSSETVKFARLWPENDEEILDLLRQVGAEGGDEIERQIIRVGSRLAYSVTGIERDGNTIARRGIVLYSTQVLQPNGLGGYDRIDIPRSPDWRTPVLSTLKEQEKSGVDPLPVRGTPVPEAWIPVDDPAFLDVLKQYDSNPAEADRILSEVIARHPGNAFYPVAALDLALLRQDQPRLVALLDQCEKPLRASGRPYLSITPDYYHEWLRAWERSQKGENFWLLNQQLVPPSGQPKRFVSPPQGFPLVSQSDTGLNADLARLVRTFQAVRLSHTFFPLDRPLLFRDYRSSNFLPLQLTAKVMATLGDFRLFAGDPKGALALELPCHRIGLVMSRDSISLIGQLIGMALRGITVHGLNRVYLDGIADAGTLRELWQPLDDAYRADLDVTQRHVHREIADPLFRIVPDVDDVNPLEANTRELVVNTRMALLHTATAARYHRMATGSYPSSSRDFGPLLPGGPDPDPFTDYAGPLQIAQWPKGTFILYSLGPDREDQSATVEYDPTNGTVSHGDLSLEVPPSRTYPFPPPGGLGTSRDSILAQFPNGLPPDRFADRRPSSYAITDTHPAWILSWGPDMDEKGRAGHANRASFPDHPAPPTFGVSTWEGQFLIFPRLIPQSPYDPTNGVVSQGDLFFSAAAPHATMLQGNLPPTPTPFVE